MEIEKIIKSNYLGIFNQEKEFYALIGASIIQFNITYRSIVYYLKKIDTTIDEEKLLRGTAGDIINIVTNIYNKKEIPDVVNRYKDLVNDRNKIIHSYILKGEGDEIFYRYDLKNGESGFLNEKFIIDFIDNCKLTLATIQIMDGDIKKKYKIFKEN